MKYIVAIIFAANVSFAFCQWPNEISKAKNDLPDKIKKVKQYQDDILLNVREYDASKNEIFRHYKQYWDDRNGYLTMITGNILQKSLNRFIFAKIKFSNHLSRMR